MIQHCTACCHFGSEQFNSKLTSLCSRTCDSNLNGTHSSCVAMRCEGVEERNIEVICETESKLRIHSTQFQHTHAHTHSHTQHTTHTLSHSHTHTKHTHQTHTHTHTHSLTTHTHITHTPSHSHTHTPHTPHTHNAHTHTNSELFLCWRHVEIPTNDASPIYSLKFKLVV